MLKILYVTRDESTWVFRGPHHFRQELARVADVHFAHRSGSIKSLLSQAPFRPDLIMLHMQPLDASPAVEGLDQTTIPKAIYVEDVHYRSADIVRFVRSNDVRYVFCPYREHFHRYLSEIGDRFRWLPHCVAPAVFRDYGLRKEIDLLMMGQVVAMYYPMRKAALDRFKGKDGFVYHGHPGYVSVADDDPRFFVGARYAREINRAKMFITCGSKWHLPVAKYFEAPACKSCLIAPGGPDFADLGFVDGKTFVACTVDDFEEKVAAYLEDSAARKRVAAEGYEMVMRRHTCAKRVREFLSIVEEEL